MAANLGAAGAIFKLKDEGYCEYATPEFETDAEEEPIILPKKEVDLLELPPWMLQLDPAIRAELCYKLIRTLPTSHISLLADRLVPLLHIDFVKVLPTEIVRHIFSFLDTRDLLRASETSKSWRRFALEPSLWRECYRREGWEANMEEVARFETEIMEAAQEQLKAEVESKRLASEEEEQDRVAKKLKRSRAARASARVVSSWTTTDSDQSGSQYSLHSTRTEPFSDDEDLYPSPMDSQDNSSLETLDLTPRLITSDWRQPRLNWLYLYKNRFKLEQNWQNNKSSVFQIPHPSYPHEGHQECIYTLQYSQKYIVSGSRDRTIRIWDMKTRRLAQNPLQGHKGSVLCLQFDESPEEDIIISGSSDSSIMVWKFSTGAVLKRISNAHGESVLNLRFNDKYLVTCSKDKCIKVWNRNKMTLSDPDYPYTSTHLWGRQAMDLTALKSIDMRMVGITIPPPISKAKNLPPYCTIQVLSGHGAAVNAIQLHGDEIVSASGDRVLKVWNIKDGTCDLTIPGHSKGIACVQYDGRYIVSGSSDCTVRVFNRETGKEEAKLEGHNLLVRTVQARLNASHPSTNRIVSGSYDETVRIWRKDGDNWFAGAVLRQPPRYEVPSSMNTSTQPAAHHPPIQMNAQAQALATAQITAQALIQAQAQSHATQLQAAHAATHAAFHQQNNVPPPQPPPAAGTAILAQPQYHLPGAFPQYVWSAGAQPAAAVPIPTPSTVRVFKLQFDARLILCCSQESKITGWDFAADEPGIVEASRFFR